MIPATSFMGQRVALFGLGGSGLSTALALQAGGAEVAAWDDKPAARGKAAEAGIEIVELTKADFRGFAALILTPGAPLTHPTPHWAARRARAAGIEIIGDIELFCRERAKLAPDAPFIAITGTNGKSTTTALTAHLLESCGMEVAIGGNFGTPILDLEPPDDNRFHVIECSSFQIDLTPSLNPTVGILINLSPDHIDRHGSMDHYAAVKERLVAAAEIAIVGVDDDYCYDIGRRLAARGGGREVIPVSVERRLDAGIFLDGASIVAREATGDFTLLGNLAGISTLRGLHNAQNAAFALGAVSRWQFPAEQLRRGLASFPGLAHRMEEVGRRGRVVFINDSKATNADATAKALASFKDIYWILGGKPKQGGIESLRPLFDEVRKAYLIGAATDEFARTLDGQVPYEACGTLDVATMRAAEDAALSQANEPVVLLSPACASYDQYANFELRGEQFRDLVRALPDNAVARMTERGAR